MLGSLHTPLRVLLLDGAHPRALAMVRSLGRRRAQVTVASTHAYAPALFSRYCADFLPCPDPRLQGVDFKRWLFATLRRERFDTLLYCSEPTAEILAAHGNTVRLYCRCALPQPILLHDLGRSRSRNELLARGQLESLIPPAGEAPPRHRRDLALLAIARRGDPVATFQHLLHQDECEEAMPWSERRAMESVEDPEVQHSGLDLLRAFAWDGIATLGFRLDVERGSWSLLGVQPVWGDGLELAIASGIDFPWLYAQLAAGNPITGPTRYRVGLRWVRPFTSGSGNGPGLRLRELLLMLRPDVRADLALRDLLPSLPLLGSIVLWVRRQARSRLRSPRRRPRLAVIPGGNRPGPPHLSSNIPTSAGGTSP